MKEVDKQIELIKSNNGEEKIIVSFCEICCSYKNKENFFIFNQEDKSLRGLDFSCLQCNCGMKYTPDSHFIITKHLYFGEKQD